MNWQLLSWSGVVKYICFAGQGIQCVCLFSVYSEMPHTITRKWQEDQMNRMLMQGQGRIEGLASKYDYEKGEWK